MSVEETIQPSFTVTANPTRPTEIVEVALGTTNPASSQSFANRNHGGVQTSPNASGRARSERSVSESLEHWTSSQRKANEESAKSPRSIGRDDGAEKSIESGETEREDRVEGQDGAEGLDTSFGPDIAEPTNESATKESETDNIPSPANTPSPPPTTSARSPAKAKLTPVSKPRTNEGFHPINRYSPHRAANFTVPSPLKSKSIFGRKAKPVVAVEQDSFAEDHVTKPIQPVEKLKRMLEHYDSGTSNGTRPEGDGAQNEDEEGKDSAGVVPGWEEEGMRAVETVPAEIGQPINAHDGEHTTTRPHTPDPTPKDQHPSSSSPHVPLDRPASPSPSPSPIHQRSGFNALIEEGSSLGMPSEVRFSQEDEFESQHSTRSAGIVATQTLASHPVYLSSPPPSPSNVGAGEAQQSHSTNETAKTTSTNSHPRSLAASAKGDGTTQEATQLVTEDEMVFQRPASPPSIPGRRTLPTARARLAGRIVVSQPADRSRMLAPERVGPHTIAGPQADQAGRQSRGPPVMEDTYIDPQTQRPESHDNGHPSSLREDIGMRSPTPESRERERDSGLDVSLAGDREGDGTMASKHSPRAAPLVSTYVDPTLTSLPPPPPKRPTPTKYGKQKAPLGRSPSASPTPSPTHFPAPGPSRSPRDSPLSSPEPAKPTKSGRVPKRKRRDSAASMSDSSSSSEDVDMFDESYRPAVKPVIKLKGKSKAANPSLKRVKNGSRSRSASRASSGPVPSKAAAQTTTTPAVVAEEPKEDSSPWILACWGQRYYIGRIVEFEYGEYVVQYEDGTKSSVKPYKVRRAILRVGDRIKDSSQKHGPEYIVQERWEGDVRGVKIGTRRLELTKVSILASVVNTDFQDRLVTPEELGYNLDPSPPPPRPNSTSTVSSVSAPARASSTSSDVFVGKIFFVTSASSTNVPRGHQKDTSALIIRHGGKFVEKWYDLFDLPSHGFGSTLASTSAPFLIQETSQASLTPKVLVSLAKGIPCLSMGYIEDAIADPNVDWRSYLVASGYSERLQQHCSQVVSGTWGSPGWNAAIAQAERRPFVGKRFLFLEPKTKKDIKRLILVCLHAMGAIAVDCVHSLASAKETKGYDFVLVEDREKKTELPEWLRNLDRACNIPWLKQCLIMGASLKPGLVKDR